MIRAILQHFRVIKISHIIYQMMLFTIPNSEFKMFKNIIVSAIIVGVIVGALWAVLQNFTTTPIILAAEAYEVSDPVTFDGNGNGNGNGNHTHDSKQAHETEQANGHGHNPDAWAPNDGFERIGYTILTSILTAIGFAMLILAAMAASNKTNLLSGILFGLAGYISFYLAPSFGLAPEIPGSQAAQLEGRQGWWLMTVLLTAAGLACMAFINSKFRFFGLGLIAIPHILGAPLPEHHGFANSDPIAVAALTNLSNEFIILTGISLLVFWLALGAASSMAAKRYFT